MSKKLRIAFMGTPDFVVPIVQSLIEGPHDLVCVYTQPPREKGRRKKLEKTPVHIVAEKAGIEVRHPANFKADEDIKAFQDLNLDAAVVAAYGMLLPSPILEAPKQGCINIHPSLLPRWRGPSPVQYAIWKGDKETGVSVMSLEKAMDTGAIIAQEKHLVSGEETFGTLNQALWDKGKNLLSKCLDDLAQTGELKNTPQSEAGVTYCKLFTKEQGHIDWNQPAEDIDRQIRALNPWPGTWCLEGNGKRFKILSASVLKEESSKNLGDVLEGGRIICGSGTVLQLNKIQPENKKSMDIKSALNGGHLTIGDTLS